MKSEKILFIDTETGGLEPSENSLLSIAFVVWQNYEIIDDKEILINDKILNVTPEAIKINKINIDKHLTSALLPPLAIEEMEKFLSLHFLKEEKITLGGHNVNFDVNFLKYFLVKNKFNFQKRFSHRIVDTATILYYLYLAGKLTQKTITSSDAFDLFGIKVLNRHSALGDATATAKLFTILLKIISSSAKLKETKRWDVPNLFD